MSPPISSQSMPSTSTKPMPLTATKNASETNVDTSLTNSKRKGDMNDEPTTTDSTKVLARRDSTTRRTSSVSGPFKRTKYDSSFSTEANDVGNDRVLIRFELIFIFVCRQNDRKIA